MKCAPTEPLPLRRLGEISSVPERYGMDFLWVANGQKHGVQRKEVKDLVASIIDGRLSKEVGQMLQVDGVRALCIEGRFVWSGDGIWMGPVRWDRFRQRQAELTLQSQGIWIMHTESLGETAEAITELERWTRKPKHQFASQRAKATGQWGSPTSKEFAVHVLQGFPGVGPEIAERIWERFGHVPLQWTVPMLEMLEVDGIGPKRADQLYRAFSVQPDPSDTAPKAPKKNGARP